MKEVKRRSLGTVAALLLTTTSVQELAYADTMNVFNMVRKEFNIDDNRIFLTGHSMGGAGAYFYAAKHPEIWAAAAPIAGGGIDDRYAPGEKVKNLPFLVMQGEKDLIVRAEASRASVAKMQELGIKHTYIEAAPITRCGFRTIPRTSPRFSSSSTVSAKRPNNKGS
jgi:predicted peptidase